VFFGQSVSIDGDTLVGGAKLSFGAGERSGSAFIFERNQGGPNNWGQVKKVTASDAAAQDQFGSGVSASGDTVVVTSAHTVYIFERNAGGPNNWGEIKKFSGFTGSIHISGDTLVVGISRCGVG